jgi:hypothetical protein
MFLSGGEQKDQQGCYSDQQPENPFGVRKFRHILPPVCSWKDSFIVPARCLNLLSLACNPESMSNAKTAGTII